MRETRPGRPPPSFWTSTAAFALSGVLLLSGCYSAGITAAQHGDAARLQGVLDRPNHNGEDIQGLIGWASYGNCPICVEELIRAGARPTSNQLASAAKRGQKKICRILIDNGADPQEAIDYLDEGAVRTKGAWSDEHKAAAELVRGLVAERARPVPSTAPSTTAVTAPTPATLVPAFHSSEHPDDYALIIGIEKYADLPAATYAENDARTMTAFVEALGVPARNVVTLTGARATRSGIAKQLEGWLANNATADSTVYFYYSGHGAPDPVKGQAYLVPVDGDPQYLEETGYPLSRVYEKLGALKAKRVVAMLDSCFSGAGGRSVLMKGARPLVNHLDTAPSGENGRLTVLAAAGGDQISGVSEENAHGLFTYHLLNGLNGAAQDASGRVTVQSLFAYLKPRVMDEAHRANRQQTPLLTGGAAPDILLH